MSKVEDKIIIPTIPPEQLLTPEQLKRLHEPVPPGTPSLAEIAEAISARVPMSEWLKLPHDLSKNVDHYLYGSPREEDEEQDQDA